MAGRVRPLGDRVLVAVVRQERVTAGGIVLPDSAREQSDRGIVLAVGPGLPVETMFDAQGYELPKGQIAYHHRPVAIDEGEVVLFSPFAGVAVSVGDEEYLLLRENDVLGVLDGVAGERDEAGEWRLREVAEVH